jgi:hypothetical protein
VGDASVIERGIREGTLTRQRDPKLEARARGEGHTMERELSDEEVTAIGFALLLATGHEAIVFNIRDVAEKYLRAKQVRRRCAVPWCRCSGLLMAPC